MQCSTDFKWSAQLAETYLRQLRAFGCFCDASSLEERLTDSGVIERLSFVTQYCQALETFGHLRFTDGEVPLLYNTAEWPEGLEPGGFVSSVSPLTPSQYVQTLGLTWNFQVLMREREASPVPRFVKAAIWVARREGAPGALRYLLALHDHGLLVSAEDLYNAVDVIIGAHRMVRDDEQLYPMFFEGRVPDDPRELIHAEMTFTPDREFVRPGQVPLQALIRLISEHVETTRSARTYDEWVRGQFVLKDQLDVLMNIVRTHVPSVSVSLQGVLDHYEEMRADAGGLVRMLSTAVLSRPLAAVFHLNVPHLRQSLGYARLVHERAVVPRALQTQLDAPGPYSLPAEWSGLSPGVARALCDARLTPQRMLDSKHPFRVEQILQSPEATEVFDAAGLPGEARHAIALEYAGELERHRYARLRADIASLLHREATDATAQAPRPDADIDDESMEAISTWIGENRKDLEPILSGIDLAMKQADVVSRIELAMRAGDEDEPDRAVEILEQLVADYPWFHPAYGELGIAHDKAGNPQQAVRFLEAAVAAEPENPVYWQSLSVVLKRLENRHDAHLCLATIAILRQVERLASAPQLASFWTEWDARW